MPGNILYYFEKSPFFLIMSSTNLIKKLKYAEYFHADFTYNIVYPQMPLLIIGFSDYSRVFHPISFILTKKETSKVFFKALNKLSDWCSKLDISLNIKTLISDLSEVFQKNEQYDFVKIDCWYHSKILMQNQFKVFEKFNENMLLDVIFLQELYNSEIFEHGVELFMKAYDHFEELSALLIDFKCKRIISHRNWFEGAFIFSPSTNNGLEGYNGTLKNHVF